MVAHYDTTVTENIMIINYVNSSSINVLMLRVANSQFTGNQYATYYQYAPANSFLTTVMFKSTLTNGVYVLSNIDYQTTMRNLIALSTQNTIAYTPSADYHPATKKYVDDTLGNIQTLLSNI